jgi:uncharacterized integral membrane protein
MDAPALTGAARRPGWRWTWPVALVTLRPVLLGVVLGCAVLQLALRCCG